MRWLLFWRPPCLLRSVIINLKSDDASAIKGVLWATRGPWLTFKECTLLKAHLSTAVDGDVIIHRSNIAFLQVLP